jgi:hypothetical protein
LSPILVRPVREQLEHDRVIRLLQAKYKRKFEVAINPGHEQSTSVLVGTAPWYPDLVLFSLERGRKLMGTVEVETAESVNNLEAMSQWKNFASLKAPFHLYIPASAIDTARRMASDLQIPVAEIWAYSALGDQMRFTLVHRTAVTEKPVRPAAPVEAKPRAAMPPSRPAETRPGAPRAATAAHASVNGRGRGARPAAAPARSARRATPSAAPAAKGRRKTTGAAARSATKTPATRRVAAKKTPARAKRK